MTNSDFEDRAAEGAGPNSIWRRIDRILGRVIGAIEVILTVAFIIAVLMNFFTAVDRAVFRRSIVGSDELQIYVMIWITFVGAAAVTWRHQHIRMDVLSARLPHALRIALLAVELVLITALTAVLFSQSMKYVSVMRMIDRRSDLGNFAMWISHSALAVGFGLICLISFWRLAKLLAGRAELEEYPWNGKV